MDTFKESRQTELCIATWADMVCHNVALVNQSGITSGFPDYGFPAYICHSRHVFQKKLKTCLGPMVTKITRKTIVWKTRRDP